MAKDNDSLLVELIKLKEVIDQLGYVFHKISVNPHSGENFGTSSRKISDKVTVVDTLSTSQSYLLGPRIRQILCTSVQASPCSFRPILTGVPMYRRVPPRSSTRYMFISSF